MKLKSIVSMKATLVPFAAAIVIVAAVSRAAGAPANALAYSGVAERDGVPVTAPSTVRVRILDNDGTELCDHSAANTPFDARGGFRVELPVSCATAVRTNADASVEVSVGGDAVAPKRITAVPYALEADHSLTADRAADATVGGALDARISATQSAVTTAEDAIADTQTALEGEINRGFVVTAKMGGSGACEIEAESTDWISSTTAGATGICTVTFTPGMFRARPVCMTGTRNKCIDIVSGDATQMVVHKSDCVGNLQNVTVDLVCVGQAP